MAAQATVPLLHRFLGIGLVLIVGLFLVLRQLGIPDALPPGTATRTLAYGLCGIGLVLAAVGRLVMRPRVPARRAGQSYEQYWGTPEVVSAALPVWFFLEGASIVPAVGYLLTAEPIAAVVAAVLVATFWLSGPQSMSQ